MIRSVSFPDEFYERLKMLADKKGISVASIIKMACKEYLDKEDEKAQK